MVYVAGREDLPDLFPESWEIVPACLNPSDGFCDSYMSAEFRLVDFFDELDLLFLSGMSFIAGWPFFLEDRSVFFVVVRRWLYGVPYRSVRLYLE